MLIAEAHEASAVRAISAQEVPVSKVATRTPLASVARGALSLMITQPLTWVTSLIVVALVPRLLGGTSLGQYTLAMTFPQILGPVVSLGLLEYLSRALASRSEDAMRKAALGWVTMTLAAVLAACAVGIAVPLLGLDVGTPVVLWAALGILVITPSQGLLLTLLRGQERMGHFAAINSLSAAASSLIPVAVLMAGGGLNGFAVSFVIVNAVALAVSWRMAGIRLPRVAFNMRDLIGVVPAGLPFFGWTLTMQFYGQIDRLLLGALAPVQVVGWYAAAQRIIGIPVFVPMLIVTPLFPALTRCRDDKPVFRRTLNTSLRAALLITAPLCAAMAAAAPAIPQFLRWPSEFTQTIVPMTILAPNLSIIAMDMLLGTSLIALGLERKWLLVGLAAAVVNPTLNFLAIPYAQATWGNGSIGSSVVNVITEFVMLGGALVLMPRGLLDTSLLSCAMRILVAGAGFIVTTRVLLGEALSLPVALLAGGAVFLVASLALGVVRPADFRGVRSVLLTRARGRVLV